MTRASADRFLFEPPQIADPAWSSEFGFMDDVIARALAEDLSSGDVTSRCVVPADHHGMAEIVAKEPLVLAGLSIAMAVFRVVDSAVHVESDLRDGQSLAAGNVVLTLQGASRSILAAERTALNLLQRACGVATTTRRYVEAAGGRMRVVDTRKTMPGLRALDRYAVRCGGGHNHRNDLGAGVLIKENHIACAGGVEAAVKAALREAPHTLRVECEVQSLGELQEAIAAGVHAVLLDNMDDATLAQAVAINNGRVILEASGGITLTRIGQLATLGIDVVSVGALTHSVKAADLSLLMRVAP